MYKVEYTRLALMPDGSKGNISQGDNVAYMNCIITEIDQRLNDALSAPANKKRYIALINNIKRIQGHIVI